jgi:hypothetical protein
MRDKSDKTLIATIEKITQENKKLYDSWESSYEQKRKGLAEAYCVKLVEHQRKQPIAAERPHTRRNGSER